MRARLAAALLLALAGPAAASPPEEKPFPATDHSVILREEGIVYLVQGRVRIPRGVEVSCQKDIHIRGIGKGPSVIEVEGSFKAHGVSAREVIFEGVTVEPAASFGKIQLDSCIFRDKGGVATPVDRPAGGEIQLQFVKFQTGARLDLSLSGTSVQVLDSMGSGPLHLRGVDAEGSPNRLKAVVRGSTFGGMQAENVADLTVRLSGISADPVAFRDCGVLLFDGNKVEAKAMTFQQTRAGCFSRTQLIKCDLYSRRIVFQAPADLKVGDTVVVDKCWFEGETAAAEIAKRIVDAADDPKQNVRASVTNPQERPLELAGSVNR
jgi:hypothetical protein